VSTLPGFITAIDFETTSITDPRATEIGLVALDEDLKPVSTFETVIKPPRQVAKRALGVSRLSMDQIISAKIFSDYWGNIQPYFDNRILIAHNAEFDMKVLRAELADIGISKLPPSVCTCLLARKIMPAAVNHRLGHLCGLLDISLNAHRALSDAAACGNLLAELISISDETAHAEISRAMAGITSFGVPSKAPSEPLIRQSVEVPRRNEDQAYETFKEIIASGKTQVALTGSPKIGKSAFGELVASIGYLYKETTPGPRHTAFLVKANSDAGERKIRHATEAGVPVLREEEFHHFVDLVGEMGA
jgi:DNA polymerase-3 subunit epsilon